LAFSTLSDPAPVDAGLGAENYAGLAAVTAQYDPDNVFHLNHNIKPATPQRHR
jgi:hypothetical protein